jgi:hypothetical protein
VKGLMRSRKRTVHRKLLVARKREWFTGRWGILTTTHDGDCAQAARSPGGGLIVLSRSGEDFSTTSRWVWW